jgi:hypothetical protein
VNTAGAPADARAIGIRARKIMKVIKDPHLAAALLNAQIRIRSRASVPLSVRLKGKVCIRGEGCLLLGNGITPSPATLDHRRSFLASKTSANTAASSFLAHKPGRARDRRVTVAPVVPTAGEQAHLVADAAHLQPISVVRWRSRTTGEDSYSLGRRQARLNGCSLGVAF